VIAIPALGVSLAVAATGHFTAAWALLLIGFCDAVFGGYAKPARKPAYEPVDRINEYVAFDASKWLP
jgi:hypothetical protein